MIYSPLSSILRSKEFALALNAQPSADGQAMVSVLVAGVAGVQPSDGVADEKFAGFTNTQTSAASFLQTTAVVVEDVVLPSSKAVTLGRAPIAGTAIARDKDTGVVVAIASVVGKVATISAGTAGQNLSITYRYNLTVVEARSRNGDVTPGGYAGLTTGSVSLVQAGTVYTDQFDTSADFAEVGAKIVLADNGLITTDTVNANGTPISGAIVGLPSVDYPYLGIDFDTY